METGYQRGKIQDESMLYEHRKHDGAADHRVNRFLSPRAIPTKLNSRVPPRKKKEPDQRLREFRQASELNLAPRRSNACGPRRSTTKIFAELVNAVRHCTLDEITNALFLRSAGGTDGICCTVVCHCGERVAPVAIL